MATPQFLSALAGTMRSLFQVGGPSGPALKNNAGVLDVRNAADSAWIDLEAKSIKVLGTNGVTGVKLASPGGLGASLTLTLPNSVGGAGQFLQTDGSGGLNWSSAQSNADLTDVTSITQATASPAAMFTPPANAVIREIWINVTIAAAGGSPTLSIGITGTPALYVATSDLDLKAANLYVIPVYVSAGASPAQIIATITPSAQTFSADIYVVYTNPS